jgi:hypothetical protein
MNRQAALALFAVSLTLLPACVTKVVEVPASSTTKVSATPTTTTAPPALTGEPTVANTVSAETLRKRQGSNTRFDFIARVKVVYYPETLMTQEQADTYWALAQEACGYFDSGMDIPEWSRFMGMYEDNYFDEYERLAIGLATLGILTICPEHTALAEEGRPYSG